MFSCPPHKSCQPCPWSTNWPRLLNSLRMDSEAHTLNNQCLTISSGTLHKSCQPSPENILVMPKGSLASIRFYNQKTFKMRL